MRWRKGLTMIQDKTRECFLPCPAVHRGINKFQKRPRIGTGPRRSARSEGILSHSHKKSKGIRRTGVSPICRVRATTAQAAGPVWVQVNCAAVEGSLRGRAAPEAIPIEISRRLFGLNGQGKHRFYRIFRHALSPTELKAGGIRPRPAAGRRKFRPECNPPLLPR